MQVRSVLCVCTGNICRSPLAEGLIRRDAPSLSAASAGIAAVVGGRMPREAATIARREGLDLAGHRGRQITEAMVHEHDLVLVMEDDQKYWITTQYPEIRERVFLVTHWQQRQDIPDPYRRSFACFEQAYQQLSAAIGDWLIRIAPLRMANRAR